MTTKETSQLIGCSQRYVRTLVNQGKIRAEQQTVDVGQEGPYQTVYDISLEEVRRFLAIPQRQGWPRGKPRK